MKAHAVTFALLMIASSLAGCTTAGTDGVPEVTLDDEDIETFLDDYFQDFVNNSSVVINQEIHYHNETTVNEGDDSSVRHYNGSGLGAPSVYVLDMVIDSSLLSSEDGEEIPDYRNNTLTIQHEYYNHNTSEYRNDEFTILCSDYYLMPDPYWIDGNDYYIVWVYLYNETFAHIMDQYGNNGTLQETCGASAMNAARNQDFIETFDIIIEIPEGHVLSCIPDVGLNNPNHAYYMLDLYHRPNYDNYTQIGFSSETTLFNGGNHNTWGQGYVYFHHNEYLLQYNHSHVSSPGASMMVGDLSHGCSNYAGDGSETDYVITVEFHTLTQVRILFYYHLTPVEI